MKTSMNASRANHNMLQMTRGLCSLLLCLAMASADLEHDILYAGRVVGARDDYSTHWESRDHIDKAL